MARLSRSGLSPSEAAIAGRAVAITVELRFSMKRALATMSGISTRRCKDGPRGRKALGGRAKPGPALPEDPARRAGPCLAGPVAGAAMTDARPALPLTFLTGPWRLSMGLNALDLRDWLLLDESYAAEMAERRELIEGRLDDVHAMLPQAEEASAEVLELVAAWLVERQPERFERAGRR